MRLDITKVKALLLSVAKEMDYEKRLPKIEIGKPIGGCCAHYEYYRSTIVLKKSLLEESLGSIKNVLRHEMAHHYLGASIKHDKLFRDTCKKFGWGEKVYLADGDFREEEVIGNQ